MRSPPSSWWELRGWKCLILITLDCWKRHFQEKNYIKWQFTSIYLLKLLFKNVEGILKYYLGRFFLAPIPRKWYKSTSGFITALFNIMYSLSNVVVILLWHKSLCNQLYCNKFIFEWIHFTELSFELDFSSNFFIALCWFGLSRNGFISGYTCKI